MRQPDSKFKSELGYLVGFFRERPSASVGLFLVLICVMLMFFGHILAPYDPELATPDFLEPPSARHWLGTDRLGLDIFSRIITAPRIDLTIGIVATTIAALIGTPFGVISGYIHGWLGNTVARAFDILQCLPAFIVAMCLVAFSGPSVVNVIIVLALLISPIFVRLVRSKTYTVMQRTFVESAVCLGNSKWRIVFRHLLPNCLEPVLVQFPVNVGWAILMTASLSFIGAGVRPPTPEWGSMISIGAPLLITGEWWVALFPGMAIGLCVLGLALVGGALEILLDPTRR